jgi:septal ring factor EnvC (AmiA/AmiB activator)
MTNIWGLKKKLKEMRNKLKNSEKELGNEYRNRRKDWDKIDYLTRKIRHLEIKMAHYRSKIKKIKLERKKKIGK